MKVSSGGLVRVHFTVQSINTSTRTMH